MRKTHRPSLTAVFTTGYKCSKTKKIHDLACIPVSIQLKLNKYSADHQKFPKKIITACVIPAKKLIWALSLSL
jgi:hypothetical protein